MTIYADSAAGSTGPQLPYQAIGSSTPRTYVQGQDDRGSFRSQTVSSSWPSGLQVRHG